MIGVFRDSGFDVEVRSAPGELEVAFPAVLGESARLTFEERDRAAAAAAVAHVLRPASIAVIGASARPGSVGAAVLANLRHGGFKGPVHLVHPRGVTIDGLTSRSDVPEVELAVVAVPAAAVVEVARECAAAGVQALVVLSAGFAEVGPAGAARQAELLAVCRTAGMRLVGPNCLGVASTADDVAMNATFTPRPPPPGRLAFASQSGAYGITAIAEAAAARDRAVELRLDGQQGRPLRQRLPAVLGGRREHRRHRALPRVVRQPAAIRPHRPPRGRAQADPRGQERPFRGRRARRVVAHRRAARGLRRDGRRAVPARRCHPRGDRRRAVRRGVAAGRPSAPARRPGRDHHQRRRARDLLRGRVRGGRPAGPGARRGHPRTRSRRDCRRRPAPRTRST